MCCHDGAYLLPGEFVVDGSWRGEHLGRKTATRPHDCANPDFPAHFTRGRGQHPWTFKPAACWQLPLQAPGLASRKPHLTPESLAA
jgi:hypothetical protein